MKHCKPVEIRERRASGLGPGTFVRAAYLAQVITTAAVALALVPFAVTSRPTAALMLCFTLAFGLTPVIWMTAAVLGAIVLLPRWLWMNGRNRVLPTRFVKVAHGNLWDDWLDGPS
jgi:hypothetical protein